MNLTPAEIRNRAFKQRWLSGYDMDEVEGFLKGVADDFEALMAENDELRAQVKAMESELGDARNKRRLLEDALISAQRIVEHMKDNAKREAELILKDAELRADQWIASANTQITELKREIGELERLRKDYELKFRSLLESHMALLEMVSAPEKRPVPESKTAAVEIPKGS